MALPADTCVQCRALVPSDQMAQHIAWHNALSLMLGGHPHGALPLRKGADK